MTQIVGISIDKSFNGSPVIAHIDLRKHSEFIPLLKKKGVEIDIPVKLSAKMKNALKETEFRKGNINNFWNE